MKGFDIDKAREFARKRQQEMIRKNQRRFKEAWHDFDKIVGMLIKKYNPKRIYQWGSLLNEGHFSEISDIDIAVEGVGSAERFFEMFGDADKLTKFSLHLVELEKIEPLHAEGIRERGRLVYQR